VTERLTRKTTTNRESKPMSECRWSGVEPRLDEVLRDPIVRAMMQCDGVSEREVLVAVAKAARGHELGLTIPLAPAQVRA
jgi:hypothetical protein